MGIGKDVVMNVLKARNKSKCDRCMERMKEEAERQVHQYRLEDQYDLHSFYVENIGTNERDHYLTMFLAAAVNVGIDDDTVRKIFEAIVMYSAVGEMFGKKITSEDIERSIKEHFGFDFDRVEYHRESLEEMSKRFWIEYEKEKKENE